MSPSLSLFQRGRWARLKAREPQIVWEVGLVVAGLALIGWTLHLYPAFDITAHAPSSHPSLTSSAADRQIEAAQSYIASHPDDFNTYIALAMAHYVKGPTHYVEGINALEKARDLGATSEHLFFYAGVMYEALGLPDYAANEFMKYLRHHPNDYETMIRLANVQFRLKHTDEALELYKEAIKLWPKDATAWFNYALINKEKGNYPIALSNLDQVVKIAGRLPAGGYFEKGEIYRLAGDQEKAFASYQKELTIQPNHIPSLEATEVIIRAKGDQKQSRELRKRIADLKQQLRAQQKQQAAQAAAVAAVTAAPTPTPASVPAVTAPVAVMPAKIPTPPVSISTGEPHG